MGLIRFILIDLALMLLAPENAGHNYGPAQTSNRLPMLWDG